MVMTGDITSAAV